MVVILRQHLRNSPNIWMIWKVISSAGLRVFSIYYGVCTILKMTVDKFLFPRRFPLNEEGSLLDKEDKFIRNLIDAYEVPDEEGITEPCGLFLKRRTPKTERSQRFYAKSNRVSKRTNCFGRTTSNGARHVLYSTRKPVQMLN